MSIGRTMNMPQPSLTPVQTPGLLCAGGVCGVYWVGVCMLLGSGGMGGAFSPRD